MRKKGEGNATDGVQINHGFVSNCLKISGFFIAGHHACYKTAAPFLSCFLSNLNEPINNTSAQREKNENL